ncbi:hypothetical protein D9M68_822300 [compost metagenome]
MAALTIRPVNSLMLPALSALRHTSIRFMASSSNLRCRSRSTVQPLRFILNCSKLSALTVSFLNQVFLLSQPAAVVSKIYAPCAAEAIPALPRPVPRDRGPPFPFLVDLSSLNCMMVLKVPDGVTKRSSISLVKPVRCIMAIATSPPAVVCTLHRWSWAGSDGLPVV